MRPGDYRVAVRRLALCLFIAVCLTGSAGVAASEAAKVASAPTASARDVLARVRPAVIQVQGFFGSNTAKSFHGSGFAVAPGGVFMTNYHVVAEYVNHPTKYRLGYRTPGGKSGELKVIAVDVRHDLAVVRADGHSPAPLTILRTVPAQGSRAYSIGYPLDVGLTITEGVSNGKVGDSFDPRIHYSGALNGGMSGGPAVNSDGEVLGVNVSVYRFSQSISFLVPGEHAVNLLWRVLRSPLGAPDIKFADLKAPDLKAKVATQMRAHSRKLLDALQGPLKAELTAGYVLPGKIAPFMACSASGDPTPDEPVQESRIDCSAKAGVYLKKNFSSGSLQYTHYFMATDKLDAWRFTKKLSAKTSTSGAHGVREHVGPFACKKRNVTLKGFDANIVLCTRAVRWLDGLYDFTVRVSSLDNTKRGFTSDMDLWGIEFDAGMDFIRRYIAAMEAKS